jgi:hypothetical protein
MSRKGGIKMGMEMGGSMLAPTLSILKLPAALARAREPGKIAIRQRL